MKGIELVNRNHPLDSNYEPKNLVLFWKMNVMVKKEIIGPFMRLNKRLEKRNLEPLVIVSGYRTYAYQKKLFDNKTLFFVSQGQSLEEAQENAAHIVARPGTSEHQLGLAIDVTLKSLLHLKDPLIEDFAKTETGKWLGENSFKEGFILRYPKGKEEQTGVTYEPWHYRYVGKKLAVILKDKEICLEEYFNA